MKAFLSLTLGIALLLGRPAVTSTQDETMAEEKEHTHLRKSQGDMTILSTEANTEVVLAIFSAIERRDPRRPNPSWGLDLFQPDVEFHWPPALPYGGTFRGPNREGPTWSSTWDPLQPTEAERRMNARVVAAGGDEVVILWHQRGVSPTGERFDGEVLGLYQVREGKLARAQMFYFDTAAVASFLAKAMVK